MVRLTTEDVAGRCVFQCDGCLKTFVDTDEKVEERTYDGRTYCPSCWKLGEFEIEIEEESQINQIY